MTPGQAAYEAWRGKLIPSMENMPGFGWTEIPADTRAAWEEIAQSAIGAQDFSKHCEDHCICSHCL